ncbi:MAG: endonuclease III [Methanothrix sp.]|uniref:endonuclease III domain-containing protein n=1 Tax=Methanothrix sp. TaxID=90426 RepID=UPI0025FE573E|nr:endonuclease III [Methanothrix sp.]MCQ8903295.1 endonuclease III [Methanothrix sp.]
MIEILESVYGVPEARSVDPLDLLVMTILSQNTSDINSGRAFEQLKSRFRSYTELLDASEKEIADAIRPGGLADIKAARIRGTLERLREDFGSVDLSALKKMSPEEARSYLTSIPGIGPKTASVLMLFGFGMPAMPVDTHVYRVSRRIGLVPENASIAETQRILEEITPPEKYLSLHINLIRHGRLVCRARNPLCGKCEVSGLCRYMQTRHITGASF